MNTNTLCAGVAMPERADAPGHTSSPCGYRPLAGKVLVRTDHARTRAIRLNGHTRFAVVPGRMKSAGWYVGHVVAVGEGVDVEAGDVVVVQAQSGHNVAELGDGERLVLVPARVLPSPYGDVELRRRLEQRKAWLSTPEMLGIDRAPFAPRYTEAQRGAWLYNEAQIHRLKRERSGCGRNRALHGLDDTTQPEGVLVVLERADG